MTSPGMPQTKHGAPALITDNRDFMAKKKLNSSEGLARFLPKDKH
jgi:hypothetical protein